MEVIHARVDHSHDGFVAARGDNIAGVNDIPGLEGLDVRPCEAGVVQAPLQREARIVRRGLRYDHGIGLGILHRPAAVEPLNGLAHRHLGRKFHPEEADRGMGPEYLALDPFQGGLGLGGQGRDKFGRRGAMQAAQMLPAGLAAKSGRGVLKLNQHFTGYIRLVQAFGGFEGNMARGFGLGLV